MESASDKSRRSSFVVDDVDADDATIEFNDFVVVRSTPLVIGSTNASSKESIHNKPIPIIPKTIQDVYSG